MGKTKNQKMAAGPSRRSTGITTFSHLRGRGPRLLAARPGAGEIIADLQQICQQSASQQQAEQQAREKSVSWQLEESIPPEIVSLVIGALSSACYRSIKNSPEISGHGDWAEDILQRLQQLRRPLASADYFIGELRWALAVNLENSAAEQPDSPTAVVNLWSELKDSLYYCRQKARPGGAEEENSYYPRDSWEEAGDIIAAAEQSPAWAAGLDQSQQQAVREGLQVISALLQDPEQPEIFQRLQAVLFSNQQAFCRPLDDDQQAAERIRQAIAAQQATSWVLGLLSALITRRSRRPQRQLDQRDC